MIYEPKVRDETLFRTDSQEFPVLTHRPRKQVTVNARLVLVGASDTGVSFLESFILVSLVSANSFIAKPGER
jgi:hypothetical protein